mgnify:CR=1 FL=1
MYLLDTCIVSKLLKEDVKVCEHVGTIKPTQLGISIITKLEINYGFELHPNRFQRQKQRWEQFYRNIHVIPFGDAEQEAAVILRAYLTKKGTPIGGYDVLIAATALANKTICVTNNTAEFNRVPKLILEDWTKLC